MSGVSRTQQATLRRLYHIEELKYNAKICRISWRFHLIMRLFFRARHLPRRGYMTLERRYSPKANTRRYFFWWGRHDKPNLESHPVKFTKTHVHRLENPHFRQKKKRPKERFFPRFKKSYSAGSATTSTPKALRARTLLIRAALPRRSRRK